MCGSKNICFLLVDYDNLLIGGFIMNLFQTLLIVVLSLILIAIVGVIVAMQYKLKIKRTRDAVLSHRELWLYYMDDKDLQGLLSNNNGKGELPNPETMTEKQYRFLVLFLNHMEMMLPSWKKYEKDWYGLFKNECLHKVYENTKLYRNKKFCKLIDKILASYNK